MKAGKEKIFRDRALRLYLQNQQKIVVLRLVRPKLFLFSWALLAGLALLGGLAWSARVPVATAGLGLVTRQEGTLGVNPAVVIVSLLPPDSLGQLKPGQRVTLSAGHLQRALTARVERVEPGVWSPESIRRRFGLTGAVAGSVREPVSLAVARVEAASGGLPAAAYSGGSYPIAVETGSRRIVSLIPGLKSLAEDRRP